MRFGPFKSVDFGSNDMWIITRTNIRNSQTEFNQHVTNRVGTIARNQRRPIRDNRTTN